MAVKINYKIIFLLLIVLALIPWQKTFAGSLQKPPNNLGLVGYWSFNEGTSTQAGDSSGYRNNGTLTAMSDTPTATSGWTNSGKLGGALYFDGTDDDFNASNIAVNTTASAWNTVSFWMYWTGDTDGGNGRAAFQFGFEGTTYGLWHKVASSCFGFNTFNGDCWGVNPSGFENRWVHVVALFYNGATSNSRLFIDGVEQILSGSSNTRTVENYISIGTANPTYEWQGKIDEVRIYSRALSDAEIYALYRSGSAKINANTNNYLISGLVGLWSFNGGDMTSTVAYDRSGGARHLTLNGSPIKSLGKLGQALSFSANTDYATINSAPTTVTDNWSISAWMKPANLSQLGFAVYNGNDSGG